MSQRRVALFIPDLTGGGAERCTLRLAEGFLSQGDAVDLVLMRTSGPYEEHLPSGVRTIRLEKPRMFAAFPALVRYLRSTRPDVLVSSLTHANIAVLLARRVARVSTRVIVVSESVSRQFKESPLIALRLAHWFLIRRVYPWADLVVTTTHAMAEDFEKTYGIRGDRLSVIRNPIVHPSIRAMAGENISHTWLTRADCPLVLAVGRLERVKDYASLLRAFARVRERTRVRLVILGEGDLEHELKALAEQLNIADDIDLPGFEQNPYAYMARCSVYVLSSLWEGLPTVLVEALYCGAPIVSVDCHSGPAEILDHGRYGRLVEPGNIEQLADAITDTLREPCPGPDEAWFEQFQVMSVITSYIKALEDADGRTQRSEAVATP